MRVGDLVGIGWNGSTKQPYVAIVKRVSTAWDRKRRQEEIRGYIVFIPATGLDTFITPRDVKVLDESG